MWYCIVILISVSLMANILVIFSCAFSPFAYLIWRNTYSSLRPFKTWSFIFLLYCKNSLYILDILNIYRDIWFANKFYHSVGGLFTYFQNVLRRTKVFNFYEFPFTFLLLLRFLFIKMQPCGMCIYLCVRGVCVDKKW